MPLDFSDLDQLALNGVVARRGPPPGGIGRAPFWSVQTQGQAPDPEGTFEKMPEVPALRATVSDDAPYNPVDVVRFRSSVAKGRPSMTPEMARLVRIYSAVADRLEKMEGFGPRVDGLDAKDRALIKIRSLVDTINAGKMTQAQAVSGVRWLEKRRDDVARRRAELTRFQDRTAPNQQQIAAGLGLRESRTEPGTYVDPYISRYSRATEDMFRGRDFAPGGQVLAPLQENPDKPGAYLPRTVDTEATRVLNARRFAAQTMLDRRREQASRMERVGGLATPAQPWSRPVTPIAGGTRGLRDAAERGDQEAKDRLRSIGLSW